MLAVKGEVEGRVGGELTALTLLTVHNPQERERERDHRGEER